MEGEDLTSRLHADGVDQAELELVIRSSFGAGSYTVPQEIHHARTHHGCALKVLYDEDGKLTKVLAGPDLQPVEVEELEKRINAEILTQGPLKVRRRLLFSTVPTQGSFRYKDLFQIIPVPPEAPRPKYPLLGGNQLFLEFAVQTSSNFMISNHRQERFGRQLELLLASLTKYGLKSIGIESRRHWSLDVSSNGNAVLPTKFLKEEYGWNGQIMEVDKFSDGYPVLEKIDTTQYYSIRRSPEQELDLPSDIHDQLDRFYALKRSEQGKLLRASYWFQHADRVFHLSKSASFVALVSAVEALLPPPKGGKQCPECKQMLGTGLTKQFADFVDALSPGIPEPERKRFYRLRSALSHGGKLLLDDEGIFWGFTPEQLGEGCDFGAMWQIVQTVLHSWLRTQKVET
jgi:hypothetical protein